MQKAFCGDCFFGWIDSFLYDHVVIQMHDTVSGSGLFSSRYLCLGHCYFGCSVVFKECAYDSIRQICVQRQLVPSGIVRNHPEILDEMFAHSILCL